MGELTSRGSHNNGPTGVCCHLRGARRVVGLIAAARAWSGAAVVVKFARGAHELAEALVGPSIEIFARVDREFSGLAEGRAAAEAGIFC